MGAGTKAALIGTGIAASGILAGRAGWLGHSIQRGVGKMEMSLGKTLGSTGLRKDGIQTSVKARQNELFANKAKRMEEAGQEWTTEAQDAYKKSLENRYKNLTNKDIADKNVTRDFFTFKQPEEKAAENAAEAANSVGQ